MRKVLYNLFILTAAAVWALSMTSCSKSAGLVDHGPYVNPPGLAVQFLADKPEPADGLPGDEILFHVKGLKDLSRFDFFINQVKAEVLNFTDSLITVRVPEGVSSGTVSVLSDAGQYYYGPVFRVDGNVAIDPTFKIGNGTDGIIYQIIPSGVNNLVAVGSFTDFNGQKSSNPVNNLVTMSKDGVYISNNSAKGVGGRLNSITQINNSSKFLIGGSFGSYNDIGGINNLTRINDNMSVDSMLVELVNPDTTFHPENSIDTVAAFNGGVQGSINRIFYDASSSKYIGIGNFDRYIDVYYPRSEKNTLLTNTTRISNFVRFGDDGDLDSSYNFSLGNSNISRVLNGYIDDGIQLVNGKIIVVGSFTTFNGASASRIVALASDGTFKMDEAFSQNIGSGADDDIETITYNITTHKILITGAFKHFNGQVVSGIVMLNEDGSIDKGFQFGKLDGGSPNYAGQLSNGLIIVSGSFTKYNDLIRQGFMIINPDGSLAKGYNNSGTFSGVIKGIMETKNSLSQPSVLIYGLINMFDNTKAGNIIRITIGN